MSFQNCAEQRIVELSGTIRQFPKFDNAHETFSVTTVNRNRMVWKVGGVSEYVFDPCLERSGVK